MRHLKHYLLLYVFIFMLFTIYVDAYYLDNGRRHVSLKLISI